VSLKQKKVAAAIAGAGVLTATGLATRNFQTVLAEAATFNGTLWTNAELHIAVVSYVSPYALVVACCGAAYCGIVSWQRTQDERQVRKDERESRKRREALQVRREERGEAFKADCQAHISMLMAQMVQRPETSGEVVATVRLMIEVMAEMSNVHGLEVSKPVVADNESDDSTTVLSSKPSKRSPK
jgi:hypothetical protein